MEIFLFTIYFLNVLIEFRPSVNVERERGEREGEEERESLGLKS